MKEAYLDILRCPQTQRRLQLTKAVREQGQISEGLLIEPDSGNEYPIVKRIPRFVPNDNYTRGFGFEWHTHALTQHDMHSGHTLSETRFQSATRWHEDMRNMLILEVGCGSGRFTKHALDSGARVVSIDASSAVEVNDAANGNHAKLLLAQADLYRMPFPLLSFDRIFCFGVLQHTPRPRDAFLNICRYLKPGGKIACDVYRKDLFRWLLHTKYWVRPFTRNLSPEKLYEEVKGHVDRLWPLVRLVRKIPRLGTAINWRLLVADHARLLPDADESTLKEWAYLDTFDMLSPAYDKPQTLRTFRAWHRAAGLVDIETQKRNNGYECRAIKPSTPPAT